MATKFQVGNVVKYLFGDTPRYKVMVTKEQPRKRENMADVVVPEGYDYYIIKTPLADGESANFVPVNEAHIELIPQ